MRAPSKMRTSPSVNEFALLHPIDCDVVVVVPNDPVALTSRAYDVPFIKIPCVAPDGDDVFVVVAQQIAGVLNTGCIFVAVLIKVAPLYPMCNKPDAIYICISVVLVVLVIILVVAVGILLVTLKTVRVVCVYVTEGAVLVAFAAIDNAGTPLIFVDVNPPDPLVEPNVKPLLRHSATDAVLYVEVSAASNHITQFGRACGENGHSRLLKTGGYAICYPNLYGVGILRTEHKRCQ